MLIEREVTVTKNQGYHLELRDDEDFSLSDPGVDPDDDEVWEDALKAVVQKLPPDARRRLVGSFGLCAEPGTMAFLISPDQTARIQEWQRRKMAEKPASTAIGGRFTYLITPTGIGTAVVVSDCVDGEFLDVSDYENW